YFGRIYSFFNYILRKLKNVKYIVTVWQVCGNRGETDKIDESDKIDEADKTAINLFGSMENTPL
ncbi:hypothetical protein RO787_25290, partial [Blautia coccoides]|uniref:hypothetical protein n=1 Tax=Blautia producta TaxID=33035 RepID=UPI0028A4B5F5